MKKQSIVLAVGLSTALSACGAPRQPVKALPPDFVNAVMESALAETIAENCRFYRYDKAREDRMIAVHDNRLAREGYTKRDMDANLRQMKRNGTLERQAIQMMRARNIDPNSEQSWCSAGKREKARNTNIGRYLV